MAASSTICPPQYLQSSFEVLPALLSSDGSTRLILIRHGHIAANTGGHDTLMAGWTDVPLSSRGRLEIERLKKYLSRGPRFDAIYSSPLSRASETACLLAVAGLGPLRLCPALKEINCGQLDGLPVGEVQGRFPDLWRENCAQEREDFRWPGGESYREFRDRCIAAVRSIAAAHPSGRAVIVTHAGVISQILGFLSGVSPARWGLFRPGNASITELAWRGCSGVVVSFDSRTHLSDAV